MLIQHQDDQSHAGYEPLLGSFSTGCPIHPERVGSALSQHLFVRRTDFRFPNSCRGDAGGVFAAGRDHVAIDGFGRVRIGGGMLVEAFPDAQNQRSRLLDVPARSCVVLGDLIDQLDFFEERCRIGFKKESVAQRVGCWVVEAEGFDARLVRVVERCDELLLGLLQCR